MTEKTILYTGAAGGLGAGTTLRFLRDGYRVVAVDSDRGRMETLVKLAEGEGLKRLVACEIDLSELTSLRSALDQQSEEVGGFDVVINNAAVYPSKPFESFTIAEHQAVQRVNVDAGIVCVQVALPHMRERSWGRIVNIASVTTYGGWSNLSPYVQSKGALIGLTRAWAREFGPYGVTVNAVSPGAFPTEAEKVNPNIETYAQFVLENQAVKRRGEPRDIAHALAFLISPDSGFITGQTLNVDGGWIMH